MRVMGWAMVASNTMWCTQLCGTAFIAQQTICFLTSTSTHLMRVHLSHNDITTKVHDTCHMCAPCDRTRSATPPRATARWTPPTFSSSFSSTSVHSPTALAPWPRCRRPRRACWSATCAATSGRRLSSWLSWIPRCLRPSRHLGRTT